MKKIFALVIALPVTATTPAAASEVLSAKDCQSIREEIKLKIFTVRGWNRSLRYVQDNIPCSPDRSKDEGKIVKNRNVQLAVLANYSTVYANLCKD